MYKLFLFIFICCILKHEAARILAVFPTPSISHQVTFRPLIEELVKRGHEVVVITTDPAFPKEGKPENLTEIDVHDMSYSLWKDKFIDRTNNGNKNDLKNQIKSIYELMDELFELQMSIKDVQQIIKKQTNSFDLIIVEAYMSQTLGFSHIYKVPVIQMSSFLPVYTDLINLGAPNHPLLYPAVGRQKLDNLSMLEKIKELYNHYSIENDIRNCETLFDITIRKVFGSDAPPISELYNNIDMLFVNAFPIWDSNRPVPPTIQYLGGIHVKPVKELPKDLKSYMDSSKHGIVYLSFGTNVSPSALPAAKIQTLINVLSQLPYEVIWKWDKDELPGRSKNIMISKWLPQSDLLRHPKVKFFITQGGLQSTDEAIVAGIPLLGIPMLGDQWYNVAMYVRHKIGVKVEMEDLSEETLKAAIDVLTKDDTYRENMVKFRSILYDQPQRPIDRAVWWTEYVLRHGGARHLRSPAANMRWTTYYELELITYILLVVISALSLLGFVLYKTRSIFLDTIKSNIKLKYA